MVANPAVTIFYFIFVHICVNRFHIIVFVFYTLRQCYPSVTVLHRSKYYVDED